MKASDYKFEINCIHNELNEYLRTTVPRLNLKFAITELNVSPILIARRFVKPNLR